MSKNTIKLPVKSSGIYFQSFLPDATAEEARGSIKISDANGYEFCSVRYDLGRECATIDSHKAAEEIVNALNSAPPENLMIENAIDAMEGALKYIISDYSTRADPNCMNHEIANKLRASISNLKARP